ncbi:MAG: HAD family hydrolase [SAR324 cluster bacterium]|uniref:HAD family hydrolase n=1 Tax=SAR324 cluster bacterium TaxID=2024889 RepID=A0A2A4T1A2_9DELT|nr:MAG: HAD family hydrolase [SAR324 cluster bacterium]
MHYKAIIFDLDGTLLNTLEDLGDTVNLILAAKILPTHDLEAYQYFIGEGARNLIQRALPEKERKETLIDECFAEFNRIYANNWKIKSKPYPGISTMLDKLSRQGISLNVLSNKPHSFTLQCVAAMLPEWSFQVVFGQREDVPRKPDAAGALEIAAMLGFNANEILYMGDSATDMKTAANAGMDAVGVTWGYRPQEELESNGAKFIIHHPEELISLLT